MRVADEAQQQGGQWRDHSNSEASKKQRTTNHLLSAKVTCLVVLRQILPID